MRMMTGIEFAEVRDAIARAFNADEFDMFLFERLNFDRPAWVADGPFQLVVTNVLQKFVRDGRDPDLIAEVAAVRPLKSDVQEVYRKYALALLDETRRKTIANEQLKALARYGLAPTVVIQKGGRAQLPRSTPVTNEAAERQVRALLPQLDMREWLSEALKNEERVCRIERNAVVLGTGFLVGPDTVLTNWHVIQGPIKSKTDNTGIVCRFGYRKRPNGQDEPGVEVPLKVTFAEWHVDSSPKLSDEEELAGVPAPTEDQLDHAVVRLERAFGSEPTFTRALKDGTTENGPVRGWVWVPAAMPPLAARAAPDKPGDPLFIIQHPRGEPLKVALDTNAVLVVNPTRIRYTTNTDPGSSGSPCFNLRWSPVALHHIGDTEHEPAEFNQGIPLHLIRLRLRREGKEGALGGPPPG
jgi:hypothetical protein